jgi:hypothetical protein
MQLSISPFLRLDPHFQSLCRDSCAVICGGVQPRFRPNPSNWLGPSYTLAVLCDSSEPLLLISIRKRTA